ncbi:MULTISPECIES: DUF1289 domain-containing protein [unclassified Hyphomonas]|uniref:DUF1289 domain-containing protein n=1 Tax=unclassified Hyphomonas TaxID=2630699 RepID=UPI000C38D4FA|nr:MULTISPECIES: DUF1289 domain-containing protein [unclassified Hyphomonas]MAN90662.1 DUF1289 domain-containing protein [Hyphomonadaceae bacterium]MAA81100.1 DUF1289 domain-containing protein [Hyphomonas sp.]MAL44092.1 DUF1289 domain-containing protein [Hyphomonas sp.]MAX82575.1 DUF1289 domain-containing protein [Hyphomonas sp.]MBG67094.1 DUF1289 domain-containing protein [Hyphomonas sp.]
MTTQPIKSPCIKVCAVDASTGLCLGCARSLKEIGSWVRLGPDGREKIMAELPERITRLEALGKR